MTLTEFIDESIRLATEKGEPPVAFISMRAKHGLVTAIRLCVDRGSSGLDTADKLGMLEWSLEAAVLKFPSDFPWPSTQKNARERLDWKRNAHRT
jgi:hypothetical protein